MILNKDVLMCVLLLFIAQIVIWFQLNGQLKWEWFKDNYFLMSLMGIPISLLFWWVTKIGYQGLGTLWQTRLLAFATSMMIFPLMTWIYLGEVITMKIGFHLINAI